ncbi:MAG: MBL fold metallo-hydrolase [Sphaerochaetaceae bacterium]
MVVERFALGPYQANCYAFHNTKEVWLIDPGFSGHQLASYIKSKGWVPVAILLTHSHWDHVLGIGELLQAYPDLPVGIHTDEKPYLDGKQMRKMALRFDPSLQSLDEQLWIDVPQPTMLLNDKQLIPGCNLTVLHTPGHSKGSVAYWAQKEGLLFSGDTLFASSIGRTDLPGGDSEAIITSIKTKLMTLDEATIVYPGHGESTTIGFEKTNNPWL